MAERPSASVLQERAEAAASVLPPLLVAADRVAATVTQGVHGRRRVGQGEAFWQFRRYQPGDLPQRIDWRQSAKRDHVFVRQTEWEAAQSVWLWRDGSRSMRWRSSPPLPEKRERADLLALALASLLVRGGERVALLGGGFPPTGGRAALARLALLVSREDAQTAPSLPPEQPLPRFAHLVAIGDFLSPVEEVAAALRPYAERGVMGHLLRVLDPAETTLPFAGRVRFEGLEGEGSLLLARVEGVREEYLERMERHQEGLKDLARSIGWTFTTHHTDGSPEAALLALYVMVAADERP